MRKLGTNDLRVMNQRSTSIDMYCSIYSAPMSPRVCKYQFSVDEEHAMSLNSTAKDLYIHCKPRRNGSMVNCRNWIKIGSLPNRKLIGSDWWTEVIPCLLFDRASAKFLGLAPSCPGSCSEGVAPFSKSKAVIFYAKSWEIHRNYLFPSQKPKVGFESHWIRIL